MQDQLCLPPVASKPDLTPGPLGYVQAKDICSLFDQQIHVHHVELDVPYGIHKIPQCLRPLLFATQFG
jgi:hypothetical protein